MDMPKKALWDPSAPVENQSFPSTFPMHC